MATRKVPPPPPLTAPDREHYQDMARRIAAAWISSQAGLKSIDYTRRYYVDGQPVGDFWIMVARDVTSAAHANRAAKLAKG